MPSPDHQRASDKAPSATAREQLPLTARHLEILARVARGRTNREIGEELGISERTVRNHMRSISQRISSADRTHAVVIALGNGWIPLPIQPDSEWDAGSRASEGDTSASDTSRTVESGSTLLPAAETQALGAE